MDFFLLLFVKVRTYFHVHLQVARVGFFLATLCLDQDSNPRHRDAPLFEGPLKDAPPTELPDRGILYE